MELPVISNFTTEGLTGGIEQSFAILEHFVSLELRKVTECLIFTLSSPNFYISIFAILKYTF